MSCGWSTAPESDAVPPKEFLSLMSHPLFWLPDFEPFFAGKIGGKRIKTNAESPGIRGKSLFVFIIVYGHTCASLLLSNGVPMKQIQIWLGHSNFSTTADIYAHLDMSAQMNTGNVAGAFFAKPDRKSCEQTGAAMDSDAERELSTASQMEEATAHKTRRESKPSAKPCKPDSASQAGKGKGSAACAAKESVETCKEKTSSGRTTSASRSPQNGTAKCRKPKATQKCRNL